MEEEWMEELVSDIENGRKIFLPSLQPFVEIILKTPSLGIGWLEKVILSERTSEEVAAHLCRWLREENTHATTKKAAQILTETEDFFLSFFAAEALANPWGRYFIKELQAALSNERVLGAMFSSFRTMDAAALTLQKIGGSKVEVILAPWIEKRKQELLSNDEVKRKLAIFVLSKMGDTEAFELLKELASSGDEQDYTRWQAVDVLEEIL